MDFHKGMTIVHVDDDCIITWNGSATFRVWTRSVLNGMWREVDVFTVYLDMDANFHDIIHEACKAAANYIKNLEE